LLKAKSTIFIFIDKKSRIEFLKVQLPNPESRHTHTHTHMRARTDARTEVEMVVFCSRGSNHPACCHTTLALAASLSPRLWPPSHGVVVVELLRRGSERMLSKKRTQLFHPAGCFDDGEEREAKRKEEAFRKVERTKG
jgi:hypothetical protein